MFAERRKRLRFRSRLAADVVARLDNWLIELADVFSDLWETTRGHSDWAESDKLDLGVLITRFGRCRPIPASYKAELMTQVRSDGLTRKQTIQSFVTGLARH